MADIDVPALGLQTPLAADSVPGVRGSTGFLDCRFTLSSIRTFATASLAAVAATGAYGSLTGLPTLGTVAALSYSGATSFLRGDGTFAAVAYANVTGTPTLGNVAALTYPASGTNYLKSTGAFAQVAYSELSGTPSLATVATSGAYADLSGKPTLGSLASQNGTFSGTSSGTNTGDQTTVSGNAGSATVLATGRNINGVSFNGSAAITIPVVIAEQTVASNATVTPTFANDLVTVTAQAAALNLANPTGTAVNGWGIAIRIKDNGTARALTYGTQYRAIGVTLPTTTVISKTLYLGMIYNSADTKWDVISVAQEA